MLAELTRQPQLFVELKLSKADRSYFADGLFQSDLEDLRRMAAWANEAGAHKIRHVGG